jgi:predicted  nucleic acid-binding Zn-ribbon protein
MKKAFDENVSRAKPRMRLGAAMAEAADAAQQAMAEGAPVEPELSAEVKGRLERSKTPKPSAAEAVQLALAANDVPPSPAAPKEVASDVAAIHRPPTASVAVPREKPVPTPRIVRATVVPPPELEEVQAPLPPARDDIDGASRRDKLKERLKAVRENPRPEPLPATVAEAGVLAVERIAHLQEELAKARVLNLALTQDLESARRQSERATEEARTRMDEARRLASEMEARAKLLADLEHELASLEGERNETLLALQTARQTLDAGSAEKAQLEAEIAKRDQQLADSLAEEERLCSELEASRGDVHSLRRAVETLNVERDTLARQVSELTRERLELLEARKALESVHRALSKAAAR